MMKKLLTVVALLGFATAAGPQAQEPTGLVVGMGNFFSPIVGDLDKAIAFYRDGLGLDVQGAPANADQNPALRNMFGLPDAQLRWTIGRPPAMRTGVEIVEVKKAESKPVERRIQDPGAFTLVLIVRELDPVLARLKTLGAPVVTTGGAPVDVPFGGKARGVVVKDPDGHFVELVQTPPGQTPVAGAPNIISVRVRLTVEDAGQAMRLYQQLGIGGTMNVMFESSAPVVKMLGLKADAQFRVAGMDVPNGPKLEFIDFKGVDRRTVRANIQDPGSTRMQLQVRDVDAAIESLKAAGGAVVSTGGNTVELPGRGGATTKVAIVRDPNNLFLVLIQAAPASNR
jgi:catechol 2,3-dioxygenase-like lactoylglutathione lyase family enzyme/predicted enzyme related to lactoylglutathione lyase